MPEVTVVIPTYNRAAVLARCLAAIERCDPPDVTWEIVVVDDGSRDHTSEVLQRSALPLRSLWQENAGPAAARNRGWQSSGAPLIVFTDDDTVPERRWLIEIVESFQDESVDGVGGTIVPLRRGYLADFVQLERQADHGRTDDGKVKWLVTANAAFRRSVLEEAGGFDLGFPRAAGEDVDLSLRILRAGHRLVLSPVAIVAHDHRADLRSIVQTFFRHGEASSRLSELHPEVFRQSVRAGQLWRPSHWTARYRFYRSEGAASAPVALSYLVLRVAGVTSYALGLVAATRRRKGLH
jgi:GT2 family glycosyltransferase